MSANPTPPPKRSPVELIKEQSRQLRGTLAEELAADADHFNDQSKQLIKFHGSYQQDNRDARKERHKEGAGKYYMFMVRCKIPGGKVTAQQYLTLDDLAGAHGNATLRITTRQGFQFHGVLKPHLKDLIASINHTLLTTLGACGDVNRNVMAVPAPLGPVYQELQTTADRLAAHFAPRSGAYHEIWLDGEPVAGGDQPDIEPIYGKVYLPRKFKIGLGLPEDNSIDVYAQDLGFLAIVANQDSGSGAGQSGIPSYARGKIAGYNVLVGGGMGMTHGNPSTFPYVGKPMCYVTADQVQDAAEAVVKLFRDHGNRADRKRARIKYLVHDWGVDKFRQVLAGYLPFPLVLPKEVEVTGYPLHLGWHAQGSAADSKFFYGVSIENGRIKDEGELRLRTALRTLVERWQPTIRLTPTQDMLLCDLPANAKADIEQTLQDHGVTLPERISNVQQLSMACPAIPTCGLAISEAERTLPKLVDELEVTLKRLGLEQEKITVRMTGCPNGCARPYQSDIGIVGRSGDKYALFLGGNLVGSRLNFLFKDLVPSGQIVPTLTPILERYREQRRPGEAFGDYCQRVGAETLRGIV
jgi:sulfite reductase (ferredoxin)